MCACLASSSGRFTSEVGTLMSVEQKARRATEKDGRCGDKKLTVLVGGELGHPASSMENIMDEKNRASKL